jgi:hypothetical protein
MLNHMMNYVKCKSLGNFYFICFCLVYKWMFGVYCDTFTWLECSLLNKVEEFIKQTKKSNWKIAKNIFKILCIVCENVKSIIRRIIIT